MKPELPASEDVFALLRDAASAAARNLGFSAGLPQLSPEHWQRVLVAVEDRVRMRGVELPEDWRDELAVQMGRVEALGCTSLKG